MRLVSFWQVNNIFLFNFAFNKPIRKNYDFIYRFGIKIT